MYRVWSPASHERQQFQDQEIWFSTEYRDQTLEYAAELRKTLSRENVGKQFKSIIDRVIDRESTKQKNSLDLAPELESSDTDASKPEEPSYQPLGSQTHQKIAIVSFLYNWPSTGGGNIHTTELVQFLGRTGYKVQHFCVRYDPWQIGQIEPGAPIQSQVLHFTSDAGSGMPLSSQ